MLSGFGSFDNIRQHLVIFVTYTCSAIVLNKFLLNGQAHFVSFL